MGIIITYSLQGDEARRVAVITLTGCSLNLGQHPLCQLLAYCTYYIADRDGGQVAFRRTGIDSV